MSLLEKYFINVYVRQNIKLKLLHFISTMHWVTPATAEKFENV